MIGNLYNYVQNTIVGNVPIEFEFITAVIVIIYCILIIYAAFSGIIIMNDLIRGKK